ncbi:MAG: hypothetical protein VKK42_01665 [Lyngbya sp.]|nr:hypothetical protein [Lyngbya sp.]
MNVKLVESLAQIVLSLTPEERALLEEKLQTNPNKPSQAGENRPFTTPEERAKAFREWAESHPRNSPRLSDEAVSRESIYGERG